MFSKVTNYVISRFKSDELVHTIELNNDVIVDKKKESIYNLISIKFNGLDLSDDTKKLYDYTIISVQQRDNRKVEKPSRLMEDENWIDNINECDSICTRFINHIRRMEIDENINIESVSILEPLSGYGGANLDGFRFEITLAIPNTGHCGV